MANSKVPFLAKTAVLDRLIDTADPASQPETVTIVLDFLRSNGELRSYFLRNRPNPAWVPILWENGLLDSPPLAVHTAEGLEYPLWDVQEYLLSVASEVPDYVLLHIEKLGNNPPYVGRAVLALRHLDAEYLDRAVPLISRWLTDYATAKSVEYGIWDVFYILAKGRPESAIKLFGALLRPFPNPNSRQIDDHTYGTEAISPFDSWHWGREETAVAFGALIEIDDTLLVEHCEESLRLALSIEIESGGTGTSYAWWRQSIEPSGQNYHHHHKDFLLDFLRDATAAVAARKPTSLRSIVRRYLSDGDYIFRRLGLHLLRVGFDAAPGTALQQLLKRKNYDDSLVHHEFLLLLRDVFVRLPDSAKQRVIGTILAGPPKNKLVRMAKRWANGSIFEREDYVSRAAGHWVLARLSMIEHSLTGAPLEEYQRLIAWLGDPEHPTFLSWHGSVGFVSQESPVSVDQLADLPPSELLTFMEKWQPERTLSLELREVSHEGLGQAIALTVLANVSRYKSMLADGLAVHPDYAHQFFRLAAENAKQVACTTDQWSDLISVCEELLARPNISANMDKAYDATWRDVRMRIIDLLRESLKAPNVNQTLPLRTNIRNLVLLLLEDPDPTPDMDRPAEGWFGHDDPFTVALNHVRPAALALLIEFALLRASVATTDQGTPLPMGGRIEETVAVALDHCLTDESSAVHSVFGRFLMRLCWLDRDWVNRSINAIFPMGQCENDVWAYVAAWDSYVLANSQLDPELLTRLRPYYERAIDNLRLGYVTKSYMDPVTRFAEHLVLDHFNTTRRLSDDPRQSLLNRFFIELSPEHRSKAALAVRNRCANYFDKQVPSGSWWPVARALWEDRLHAAAAMDYPTEFADEFDWFSQLLSFAPTGETLQSMWGVLQGTLHYAYAGSYRHDAWSSVENYISRQVNAEPVRAIELLTQLYEPPKRGVWFMDEHTARTRQILEVSLRHPASRQRSLDLIDILARRGDQRFRVLYDCWSVV